MLPTTPKVSVLVPVYKAEATLDACVQKHPGADLCRF